MATETNLLEQFLGCSASEAIHYMKIFNGDVERAVIAVSENRDDRGWWGHPWNVEDKTTIASDENMVSNSFIKSQLFSCLFVPSPNATCGRH